MEVRVTDIDGLAKLYLLLVFEWRSHGTWDFRSTERLVYQHSRYSYLVKPILRNEVRGLRGKHTGGCLLVGLEDLERSLHAQWRGVCIFEVN